MKIVKCDNFEFDVDYDINQSYYLSNELCDCPPDKNYYKIIGKYHHRIVEFLAQFGVDATRPDEVSWLEQDVTKQTVFYEAMYSVKGEVTRGDISEYGKAEVNVDGLDVYFNKCDFPNGQMGKCFGISVFVVLPWEQNEPYENYFYVKKPKKRFFKRIFNRSNR